MSNKSRGALSSFSEDDSSIGADYLMEAEALKKKEVNEYTIQDVSNWLHIIGLGHAAQDFVEEMITGEELVELDKDDLKSLGIRTLGERKRFASKLRRWRDHRADDASSSATSASASSASRRLVTFKGQYKKKKATFEAQYDLPLKEIEAMFAKEFGVPVKLRVMDEDNDLIPIKTDQDVYNVLEGQDKVTFQCVKKTEGKSKKGKGKKEAASSRQAAAKKAIADQASKEYAAFNGLVDAAVVINDDGTILYFNKAAETLFQLKSADVVGNNVTCLMPDTYAKKHDGYLARYMSTGVKHVIGKKRKVMGRTGSGKMIPIELAITESESPQGGSRFVAMIKDLATEPGVGGTSAEYQYLEGLQEAAIVIEDTGRIIFFNDPACKLFGYSKDQVMGELVDMLMPNPHRDNHSFYLARYMSTGQARVVGTSREVQCQLADGSLQKVNLSLSEDKRDDGSRFTGLIRVVKQTGDGKAAAGAGGKTKGRGNQDSMLRMARRLIDPVDIAGIVINKEGVIQGFNKSAEKFFGYPIAEVMGKNVTVLMNDQDAGKHAGYISNYLTTGKAKVIGKGGRVVQAKLKNGQLKDVNLSITQVDDEKGDPIFTGLMHAVLKAGQSKKDGDETESD